MSMSMTGQVGGAAGGTSLSSSVDLLQKKVDALETRMGHTMSSARGSCVENDILDLRKLLQALADKQSVDMDHVVSMFRTVDDRQLRFACIGYASNCNEQQRRTADDVINMAERFMEWVKDGTQG